VVASEERVHQLGKDRVFVAQDPGEERLVALQASEKVAAQLVADRPSPERGIGPGGLAKLAEGAWEHQVTLSGRIDVWASG
jgi:hypothetical protein